jgi:hypothetical protein
MMHDANVHHDVLHEGLRELRPALAYGQASRVQNAVMASMEHLPDVLPKESCYAIQVVYMLVLWGSDAMHLLLLHQASMNHKVLRASPNAP